MKVYISFVNELEKFDIFNIFFCRQSTKDAPVSQKKHILY